MMERGEERTLWYNRSTIAYNRKAEGGIAKYDRKRYSD